MICTNLEDHYQMLDMDDSTSLIMKFSIEFQSDKQAHPLFTYLASSLPFEGFDETHSVAKILIPLIHERHPEYLPGDSIKWNFTKFLMDRNGKVVNRFEATTDPLDMED